jgi:hypothetical protein
VIAFHDDGVVTLGEDVIVPDGFHGTGTCGGKNERAARRTVL